MSFTIVDIETTGLSKHNDKITEIAAVKYKDGQIIDKFQTLINPQIPIPTFITKLTGICNNLVKDAPTIDKVLPQFHEFIGEDIFVAHNATFDFGFLEKNFQEHHCLELTNLRLCTKKLANRLLPALPRKRLQDLCEHFEVTNIQAHRALADATATTHVFTQMISLLEQRGITCHQKMLEFEKMPCSKCH